jgi:hypothetical protein
MSFDKRFYGLYSALIADADDPESLGRVKLIIPQVLGNNITEWALPVNGSVPEINLPYGSFYTTTDQAVGVNTATVVTNWIAADTNKSYVNGTRLYVEETGDYLLSLSTIFIKTNSSSGTADMWVRINGTDVPDSNTRVTLSGSNAEVVLVATLILDLNAGDYVELVASSNSTNTAISYSPAGVGPAVPGVLSTLNLIGKWKPQPGTKAWAMFEGGDPNFPVWMGALA